MAKVLHFNYQGVMFRLYNRMDGHLEMPSGETPEGGSPKEDPLGGPPFNPPYGCPTLNPKIFMPPWYPLVTIRPKETSKLPYKKLQCLTYIKDIDLNVDI
jgi:hypothetical protein